jgi:hypothetical protein
MSNKHYHSGFDYFTPEAGTEQEMFCQACGESMSVERKEIFKYRVPGIGTTSSETETRDVFTCPFAGEDWHTQVIELRKFQRSTPSKTLSDLVEPEIKEIIACKQKSKDFNKYI